MNKNYKDMDSYEAALLYINNDDVPELYIKSTDDTFLANDVCTLLSISKNKVKKSDVTNEKFTYAPKKNRMYFRSDSLHQNTRSSLRKRPQSINGRALVKN